MEGVYLNDPMLDMFLFETSQMIEQLEEVILIGEKESKFSHDTINEIFRIMHTIKGSSAMMRYHNISTVSHCMEDIFFYLREEKPVFVDYSILSDLVLEGVDFIKLEIKKIKNGDTEDGNAVEIINSMKEFLTVLKQNNDLGSSLNKGKQSDIMEQNYYLKQKHLVSKTYDNSFKAVIFFEEGCEMENIRAYTIIHKLKDITDEIYFIPEDIIDNDESIEVIRRDGFQIYVKTDYSHEKMQEYFNHTIFLKDLELIQLKNDDEELDVFSNGKQVVKESMPILDLGEADKDIKGSSEANINTSSIHQSIISVSVAKLDMLMDLVGEMVIAEAMVIQNPDLLGMELSNFEKAARQLNKITSEIQDIVMSIRMVPLSDTFHKMHRIIRDMGKKLNKKIELTISGEDTEVDKNIIEHISDPLIHLVRNAADHGLETTEDRVSKGKPSVGIISLEAKNAGSEVLIMVKDDGKGLSKEKILDKARAYGLLNRNVEDMSEKEIYNLILLPGFSTNDNVTEFSGRGVGMDVVSKNIEMVGGSLSVDSNVDIGTTITMKIPLTLAIIDGMNIRVGKSCYTVPTTTIKESFRLRERDLITDPHGNEMIMVRGQCHNVVRLHELFQVETENTNLSGGIIIMLEQDEKTLCIFADELIGQQQVVVKAMPKYLQSFQKIRGLAGCTLLGDGSISLIIDVGGLINM